tara:strand:- start:730 stop:1362 length:633 start_codon:yes stop_codon:yes gene_type:complete
MLEIKPKNIEEIIDLKEDIFQTLSDHNMLEEIASKSYVHPNGFAKIVYETLEGTICRLHIYPPGAVADKNIHDHRWDFSSVTICGALPMSLYRVSEGKGHILHSYEKGGARGHKISRIQSCHASRVKYLSVPKMHGYYMPSDLFHRIEAVKELTITYVETYPAQRKSCYLVNSEDRSTSGEEEVFVPQALTVAKVKKVLMLVARKIQELE